MALIGYGVEEFLMQFSQVVSLNLFEANSKRLSVTIMAESLIESNQGRTYEQFSTF